MLGSEEGKEKELKINVDEELCDGCGICVTVCPVNARYCPTSLSGKAPDYPPEKHQLFQVIGGKCELLKIEHCRRLEAGEEKESVAYVKRIAPVKRLKSNMFNC